MTFRDFFHRLLRLITSSVLRLSTSKRTRKFSGKPFGGGRLIILLWASAALTESSHRLSPDPLSHWAPVTLPLASTLSSTSTVKSSSASPSGRFQRERSVCSTSA